MKIEFHPEALAEFRDAAAYYEKHQPVLGSRFINAVESAIAHIKESPTSWRIVEDDVRRYLTKVFPYAVLYSIEDGYILIVAVMHCRREPGYWRKRV
ncbi:MAG: type II toxin-antitoxin system RelE/ParE family toxin [Sulfurisoma sp.]|nr:type II toxin-antitoxin system RelE/ParE family toxin [Sulfurisoma sp.]